MELYIFNQNRQMSGIIESYEYLRWSRRYSSCGSFELKAIATDENLALLQIGNILWKNDDEEAGLIEFVEMTMQEQEFITVSGRFATGFLARRIVYATTNLSSDLGSAIGTLLNQNLISPSDSDRRISGISYAASTLGVSVNTQISYKNLLDAITDLCEAADVGIKTTFNPTTGIFAVVPYIGSATSAVFSKEYENIIEQVFTRSVMDYASFALVGGEGEGSERTFVTIGSGSGEGRHEIFVDAKDLQSADISGDYSDALVFRGNTKLAEQAMVQAFDVTVNQYGNLNYKSDFDIGSKIQAVSKRWNVSLSARITEVIEYYDRDGMSLDVTFGKQQMTIGQKLSAGIKEVQETVAATGSGGGGSTEIPDGSVTTAKLANLAVTNAKIATGTVAKTKLATAVQTSLGNADTAYQKPSTGVPTDDLADGAVTLAKIAASALPSTSNTYAQRLMTDTYASGGAINLNDYRTAGEYTFYNVSTATNFPGGTWTGSGNASHLIVQRYYSNTAMRQILTKRNSPADMWVRTGSSASAWTAWQKIQVVIPDDTAITITYASGVTSNGSYSYVSKDVVVFSERIQVTSAIAAGGRILTITDANFYPPYTTVGMIFPVANSTTLLLAQISASGVVTNAASSTVLPTGYYLMQLTYPRGGA